MIKIDFDKAKEVIMNSGYGFMEANNGLMSIIKSGMFDTDFIVFVDFVDDYENFLEFLGAIESVEKEYSYIFGIVKDICIK